MIKAIIFDCFGVLTVDRWLEFCGSIKDKNLREETRHWNYLYDSGQIPLSEFLDEVTKLTGTDRQALASIFIDPVASKNLELLDYIRTLKAQYKIGILSNVATNWVREKLLTKEEQRLFDAMVFSYEVGTGKPDPRMYETILERLGAGAQEAIFIDDLPRYIAGAEQLGIKTIHYKNYPQMKKELEEILAASPDN